MCKHGDTVPMPIGGRVVRIDACISQLVAALNCGGNIITRASCCGHGNRHGNIILELYGKELYLNIHDGREAWEAAEKALDAPDIHGEREHEPSTKEELIAELQRDLGKGNPLVTDRDGLE